MTERGRPARRASSAWLSPLCRWISRSSEDVGAVTKEMLANALTAQMSRMLTESRSIGGSGNPVTFSSGGGCSNSGATFTMTSGTTACQVKYDQAGNANYNAAPELTESVTAQKASQAITFGSVADKAYGDADFTVSATASSGLTVTFGATGDCTRAIAT